jgi:hypothetical protein
LAIEAALRDRFRVIFYVLRGNCDFGEKVSFNIENEDVFILGKE